MSEEDKAPYKRMVEEAKVAVAAREETTPPLEQSADLGLIQKRVSTPSAYMMFYKEKFPSTRAKLNSTLAAGDKLRLPDVARAIGAEWKAMSEEGKAPYKRM